MMKILWGVTLTASLIFVIESIMTFIGADTGGDFDASGADIDFSGDVDIDGGPSGMNLYTFRNLVNFVLGFGWTAILLKDKINSNALLIFISVLVGVGLVAIVMYMFKWLSGMQESGNINIYKQAVGCNGKAYLTIPGERKGTGKVQININNAVREYDAITDGDTIKTGSPIKVVEVIDASTLLVESPDSLII
ncbi:MAG: hypothetical protein MJZ16_06545 [Bacteroidales bacterium]|nr:hypothetical protein [Bacteroidales bacterium]